MKIDDLDEKILNELIANAKTPLRQIATRAGVSFVTVMNRIKRLEREKIIRKYSARIDYEKLGYSVHVMIEVRISKGKMLELEKKIAHFPNVYAVYDMTGGYDATILAKFKSTSSMDKFLKHLQSLDFVERTNTKLILNTIKNQQILV